jgi:ankyrin repeat protein
MLTQMLLLNSQEDDCDSPLCHAIGTSILDILPLLVNAEADLELERKVMGTPLLHACSCGLFPIVKYLVRAGAKIFATKGGRPCTAV